MAPPAADSAGRHRASPWKRRAAAATTVIIGRLVLRIFSTQLSGKSLCCTNLKCSTEYFFYKHTMCTRFVFYVHFCALLDALQTLLFCVYRSTHSGKIEFVLRGGENFFFRGRKFTQDAWRLRNRESIARDFRFREERKQHVTSGRFVGFELSRFCLFFGPQTLGAPCDARTC